jgi:hypothetical protein
MEMVGSAIDDHVEEHRRKQKDPIKGEMVANHIHEFLFKKFLEKKSSNGRLSKLLVVLIRKRLLSKNNQVLPTKTCG